MSPRKSRPQHNDPHLDRLPYEQGPRQGRFGRVENWREAEKRQAEQVKRHRQAHSRRAAQQDAESKGALQGGKTRLPSESGASQTANAEHSQKKRTRSYEVNPWQQGRFGRVENWREEEARRSRYQEALEAARLQVALQNQVKQAKGQQQTLATQQVPSQQQTQAAQRKPTQQQTQNKQRMQGQRQATTPNIDAMPSQKNTSKGGDSAQRPQLSMRAAAEAEAQRRQAVRARQKAVAERQQSTEAEQPIARDASKEPRQQAGTPFQEGHSAETQHQQEAHSKQQIEQNGPIEVDEGLMPMIPAGGAQEYSSNSYGQDQYSKLADLSAVAQRACEKYNRGSKGVAPGKKQKNLAENLPQVPLKVIGVLAAICIVLIVVLILLFG